MSVLVAAVLILCSTVQAGDPLPPGLANDLGYQVVWGDLHGHSNVSSDWLVEEGADPDFGPDDYFQAAIDRGLDFVLITDHAEDMSADEWAQTKAAAAAFDRPGSFFPFVGYEGTYFNPPPGGPNNTWNVMFPTLAGGTVYAHESCQGLGKPLPDANMVSREQMWANLEGTGAIGFLAHPVIVNTIDWNFGPHERAAIKALEVYSTGGRTGEDRYAVDAPQTSVTTNLTLGSVGAGNNHLEGPGLDGVTGVLVTELTREAIMDALRSRRTFSVNHDRTTVSFDANGHLMGEEFSVQVDGTGTAQISLNVAALPGNIAIRKVSVLKIAADGTESIVGYANGSTGSFTDTISPGESAAYYGIVYHNDINEAQVWTSPVFITTTPATYFFMSFK